MRLWIQILVLCQIALAMGQSIFIEDPHLKARLIGGNVASLQPGYPFNVCQPIDTNFDGELQVEECAAVYGLDISSGNITSLEGLQHFPNLKVLKCGRNLIESIDLQQLQNLEFLDCSENPLTLLNFDGLFNLKELRIASTNIKELDCRQTGITTLHCNDNLNLGYINVQNGRISELDDSMPFNFSNLPVLTALCIDADELASVYFSGMESGKAYVGEHCSGDPVNLSDILEVGELRLYPNPAAVNFNLLSERMMETVQIMSASGRVISEFNPRKRYINIDVSEIASGIYCIKVKTAFWNATLRLIKP